MSKQKANLLFWRGDVAKASIISVGCGTGASCRLAVAVLCSVILAYKCACIAGACLRACHVHTSACRQCVESVVKRWTFGSDARGCLG